MRRRKPPKPRRSYVPPAGDKRNVERGKQMIAEMIAESEKRDERKKEK